MINPADEKEGWRGAKEKAITITAIFTAITGGIIIVKTLAETIKESVEAYKELRREEKEVEK